STGQCAAPFLSSPSRPIMNTVPEGGRDCQRPEGSVSITAGRRVDGKGERERMIDVCLLGNGGMMPLPDRPLSAVAFRIESETVLFDCGEGTQVNWRSSDFSYPSLGTILLSHVHADHIAGLPGILFQISFSGRT